MRVKRVEANLECEDPHRAKAFYADGLGLTSVMDLGWIMTFASAEMAHPQLSVMSEGGSGTPVPWLSIEVDDLDAALDRLGAEGFEPEYGPVSEPWGVRRFYVRDPMGRLVNIVMHET